MHFKACDINEARSRSNTDIRKMLMKIVESCAPCVEITDYPHKDSNSCANAIRVRINKDRLKQLKVVTKGKRVFVINTLFVKDMD